jgi:putative effector of murein hydrolase
VRGDVVRVITCFRVMVDFCRHEPAFVAVLRHTPVTELVVSINVDPHAKYTLQAWQCQFDRSRNVYRTLLGTAVRLACPLYPAKNELVQRNQLVLTSPPCGATVVIVGVVVLHRPD